MKQSIKSSHKAPPSGCRFAARCECRTDHCPEKDPELADQDGGHKAARYLLDEAL